VKTPTHAEGDGAARLDRAPRAMRVRRATVEHPFGTLKAWMGSTHFRMKRLDNLRTKMSLHVLDYNPKRAIAAVDRVVSGTRLDEIAAPAAVQHVVTRPAVHRA